MGQLSGRRGWHGKERATSVNELFVKLDAGKQWWDGRHACQVWIVRAACLLALAAPAPGVPAMAQAQPVTPSERSVQPAPPTQEEPAAPATPSEAAPANQPDAPAAQPQSAIAAPSGAAGDQPGGNEMISFSQFAEPISLTALIDFISEQLGVIIMQTDAATLASAVVEFSAPIDVAKSDLLSLLQTLLTPKGFAVVRSPEGMYMVIPAGNTQVDFQEGEFAPTRIIRTPLVTPSSLKTAIDTAVAGGANAKIVYLDELGLIISTAPPRLNKAVSEIVSKIITELHSQELHRIELRHIAATEAKSRVLELTGQLQQSPTGGPQGAAAAGRTGSLGNLQERLLYDRPTNALIYRGSSEEAEIVRRYVEAVDTPARLVVRRYFAGPTAEEICQVGSRQGLGPIVHGTSGPTPVGPGVRGGDQATFGSGFVLSSLDSESFTYYGTEEQHTQVQRLVGEFADQAREESFVIEFYKLRNVAAEDTATLLDDLMQINSGSDAARSPFLPGSQDRTPRNQQRGIRRLGDAPFQTSPATTETTLRVTGGATASGDASAAGGEGGDEGSTLTPTEGVSIIADAPNNQLIIRAPRRQQREFARIIERLDERRPQVYIEVQIVTVNSSRSFQISVDTALSSPNSDVPIFTNFGLVPFGSQLPIPNSTQGFTAAVFRKDYTPFVINALATQSDARQTSMPKILVNDNEEAELSSTQDVSFATTSQGQATSITSTGGQISAGTTLTVRPTISEGGTLRLEYSIELSAFGDQPNPDLPPNRSVNNFTSIVTVPANSTIVVGGLLTDQQSNTVSKIPILGDIPLIGFAFRSQVRSSSGSTVYVFITPRILRDDTFQDLRLLTRGPLELTDLSDTTPDLVPSHMPISERIKPGMSVR